MATQRMMELALDRLHEKLRKVVQQEAEIEHQIAVIETDIYEQFGDGDNQSSLI